MNGPLKKILKRVITKGALEVVGADGEVLELGDGIGRPVRMRFTTGGAETRLLLTPDPALAEEFMEGGIVLDKGDIYDLLILIQENLNEAKLAWWHRIGDNLRFATRRVRMFNTLRRSRRNVSSHYDLTGDLYRLFLDSDMQYSCAYFETPETSLEEAQLAKKRHLAAKLDLKPGQRVLDIGCGWGGLALYLAEQCDVEVVGITLSTEQLGVAQQRAKNLGLDDRIDFRLQDYRKIDEQFDRIVSVGMFEHVGVDHYRTYFDACARLLASDGVMTLHSIGRFDGPGDTSAFIARHIFPGGYIPALSEVMPAIEKSGLLTTDIEILRLHYAETLRHWRQRFNANRDAVRELYDERFCRLWDTYLAGSEVSFRAGVMMNFQIQMALDRTVLPLTRNYMSDAEEALRRQDQQRRFELAGE